jgi:hypothetical protein
MLSARSTACSLVSAGVLIKLLHQALLAQPVEHVLLELLQDLGTTRQPGLATHR